MSEINVAFLFIWALCPVSFSIYWADIAVREKPDMHSTGFWNWNGVDFVCKRLEQCGTGQRYLNSNFIHCTNNTKCQLLKSVCLVLHLNWANCQMLTLPFSHMPYLVRNKSLRLKWLINHWILCITSGPLDQRVRFPLQQHIFCLFKKIITCMISTKR
jgi:hypothetical protein